MESQMIFFILAILFSMMFVIFLYYMYAEKFSENQDILFQEYPDTLSPEHEEARADLNANSGEVEEAKKVEEAQKIEPEKEEEVGGFIAREGPAKPQIFSVSQNIFTSKDADAVCKAFGAEQATVEQLIEGHQKGLDVCNRGWLKDDVAGFAMQKGTLGKMLSDGDHSCGTEEINISTDFNPEVRFGAWCYGIKPSPRPKEMHKKNQYVSQAEAELARKIAEYKKDLDNISILPFTANKWSQCNA